MKHESVEKELQKASHLEVRILRDKLAAANCKYDHVSKRYYGMLSMQQQSQNGVSPLLLDMEREMNAYQKQMSEVEVELEQLQRSEIQRQGRAIAVLRKSMAEKNDEDKSEDGVGSLISTPPFGHNS